MDDRKDDMMRYLLESLERGDDIGHYGKLVFAMVARHFINEDQLVDLLSNAKDTDRTAAMVLVKQVNERGYNPPKREKILEYQQQQEFPIIPNPADPDAGNVYRHLKFPDAVYEHIEHYREAQVEAEQHA
jgi:hypothetical protein